MERGREGKGEGERKVEGEREGRRGPGLTIACNVL